MNRPTEIKMKVMGPGKCSYSRQSTKEDLGEYGGDDTWGKDLTDSAQPFGGWDGEDTEDLMLIPPKHWTNKWGYLLRICFTGILVFTTVTLISMFLYDILNPKEIPPSGLRFSTDGPLGGSFSQCSLQPDEGKFDCFPEAEGEAITENDCMNRGCCWKQLEPNSAAPWCYFQHKSAYYDWNTPKEKPFGYVRYASMKNVSTPYPDPVKYLQMSVIFETEDIVRIKIFDPNNVRYQVPLFQKDHTEKPSRLNYIVDFTDFGVDVKRAKGGPTLFSISSSPLMFHDQFLELTANLGTKYVYGLGETVDSLQRSTNWSRTVLFNHDTVPTENRNLYSSHPFLMAVSPYNGGQTHGVMLLNSNAMEIILQQYQRTVAATFRTIGGIFDFRVFVGPKPSDVMRQYTDIIGKPVLPPYWALGFHLCRYNYGSLNHTSEILENNLNAGIPVEVQWNDLDYMNANNDFTYDPEKYKGLPEFVKSLHDRGIRYITLIDPGVSAGEPAGSYSPYDDGVAANIFVKNYAGEIFKGKVWNRVSTAWPDFSHPNVSTYWLKQIESFWKDVKIDGAWIDMNDPSNFDDGESKGGCPANSTLDNPPYVPHVEGGKLCYKTLCMSAKQYGGNHYDLHNLYGLQETIVTNNVMGDLRGERSLVISRSSFPGTGAYGGSWTGDVRSTWEDMQKSIPQVLSYGLYGIPMIGADICGFNGNTTVELCKRWQQLGAFYPFMRNHNTDDGIPQDPASLGPAVINATKETLRIRYTLLPYIYTTFWESHMTGTPVARPLFFEFSADFKTYPNQNQFMLGRALLVTPILVPDYVKPTIEGYVPKGTWYSYYTGEEFSSSGQLFDLSIPDNSVPVLVRGGSIIVEQTPAMTTKLSRLNPFIIKAFLGDKLDAKSEFFWDDGIGFGFIGGAYNQFSMTASNNDLMIEKIKYGYADIDMKLEMIKVLGIRGHVTTATLNNMNWNFTFTQETQTLELKTPGTSLKDGIQLKWTTTVSRK